MLFLLLFDRTFYKSFHTEKKEKKEKEILKCYDVSLFWNYLNIKLVKYRLTHWQIINDHSNYKVPNIYKFLSLYKY